MKVRFADIAAVRLVSLAGYSAAGAETCLVTYHFGILGAVWCHHTQADEGSRRANGIVKTMA